MSQHPRSSYETSRQLCYDRKIVISICQRLYYCCTRLKKGCSTYVDVYLVLLLYLHLFWHNWQLRVRTDSIRRSLVGKSLALPRGAWRQIERLLPLVVPLVPGARKQRCLVMSVIGFRYLQREVAGDVTFYIGVSKQGRSGRRFHAWLNLDGGEAFDTDPCRTYQSLYSYRLA